MSRLIALAAALLAIGTLTAASGTDRRATPGAGRADSVVPPADHHMHVWSEEAVDALLRIQEAVDQRVISPEEARPLDAENVLAALDSAGIRRGVLLSTAYFFGSPDVDFENERAKVRAENDYVAGLAADHPDRLNAFFSVNPLAPYAVPETKRCAAAPACAGLKLHLANADFDFRAPEEVERLRQVFRAADELGLSVIVHLRTRRQDFGRREVEIFIDEVLSAAPEVPVQVAHLGGKSGYDAATDAAVKAFAAAFEARPEATRHVFFDLAATPYPEALARGDSTLLEQVRAVNRQVAEAVRTLGPDRIVYGSDWPAVSEPLYMRGIRSALPLERPVVRDLLDDAAPYLPR